MELNFERTVVSCLDTVLREVQNSEQTQEIKLPDGMPDIGQVLMAWGQPILRGKEWHTDSVSFSGGMMVWVLYAPEDGSQERCIDTWIPFQMKWDLPGDLPEGDIRIALLPRFVDGRSVSPRKILVRSGLAAMVEAFVPQEAEVFLPGTVPGDLQLRRMSYPMRLQKEAGEKSFLIDEDLAVPDSVPKPEKVLYSRLNPRLSDRRVLANKVVYRGNGNLHVLYRSEEGQLHNWDFELPFSQFAQLQGEHSADAQAEVVLTPTNMELDMDEEGHLHLKCGMVAQYLITDKQMVELVEDAYSPSRELNIAWDALAMPTVLETRRENLYGEQTLPVQANLAADVSFLPEFPRQRRGENTVEMELPGTFQILYYGEDGILHSATARWEGRHTVAADENSHIWAMPQYAEPQAITGNGQILAKAEIPMEFTATARQPIPMVAGLELGEERTLDPNRPSLILRRAGDSGLWETAKAAGSTVDAIRRANNLQDEPVPGQMLLIPVS